MRPAAAMPPPASATATDRRVLLSTVSRHFSSRHSRIVGLLKLVLPLAAAVLTLLVLAWPQIQPRPLAPEGRPTDPSVSDATSGRMANPRFTGVDANDNPFMISAASAKRALGSETDLIDLEAPQADVLAEDGTWIAISAETGRYRESSRVLELFGGVNLFHDEGYEIHTERAEINIATGVATGNRPVRGHGPIGELAGEGFRLERERERLTLTGRSRLVIFPSSPGMDKR